MDVNSQGGGSDSALFCEVVPQSRDSTALIVSLRARRTRAVDVSQSAFRLERFVSRRETMRLWS
jgi:hypothetical protein